MKTVNQITLLCLLLIFSFSCAHRPMVSEVEVAANRTPAQSSQKGCFSILDNLFKNTKVTRQLKKEVSEVADKFGNDDGQEALRSMVDRLQEDVSQLGSEELDSSWLRLRAIYTRYSEKVADGHSDFSRLRGEFKEVSEEFITLYSQVRRPVVSNNHQERLEMMRPLISRGEESVSQYEKKNIEFRRYIAYKDFTEDLSYSDREELQAFGWWAQKNIEFDDFRDQKFESLYRRKKEEFRKAYKAMSKAEKTNLEFSGKESALKQYNELADKTLTFETSADELRSEALLLLKTFGDLEPNFRSNDFLVWLFKEEKLNRAKMKDALNLAQKEGFELKLGDFLRQSYKEYAPFQNLAPPPKADDAKGVVEKVKSWLPTFKQEAPECESLECVMNRTTRSWKRFFGAKYYKDSLSCLAHNPLVMKSLVMDVGIVWATLYWHYRNNPEEYQRFPYEILINGAVFAPILAEANCRASFKSALPFGDPLPKSEVFTSKGKRYARWFKNWQGIAFKGVISSVGLMTMTYGMDSFLLAMGHAIAKPLDLNNMLVLLPVTYLYHGVWMGFKQMAIINPLRHKILPRLAQIIERKTKLKGSSWLLQTGLDFAAFKALLLYNSWDYLVIYQAKLFPFMTGLFSAGVTLEHERGISPDGKVLDTFEGVSEAGVKTETVLSEEDGQVRLESVDIDVDDEALESWVDQMLQEE